jgi:hypothetical protein
VTGFRVRAIVAVVAIVALVGAAAIVLGLRSNDEPPTPQPPPDVALLLIQYRDVSGYAAANVVVGTAASTIPTSTDGLLDLPASVLLPVGDDSVTLGATAQSSDTLASVQAVTDGLGIPIDAGLTIDRLALAGLVDGVRGVWVKVPEITPLDDPDGSSGVIRVVGPGWVLMDGVTAADYASTRLPGEPESAAADRFMAVLSSALERLPPSPERLAQFLTSLGSLASPTVPSGALVEPLLQARHAMRANSVTVGRLPVLVIRDGIRPASVPAPGWEREVTAVLGVVPGAPEPAP